MAEMVTFLITALFIVTVLAVALYYWQKPTSPTEPATLLREPNPRSLFDPPETHALTASDSSERRCFLARAQAGEKEVLSDANRANDSALYDETLNLLVAEAAGPRLLSVVSYICRNNLPVNKSLAGTFIEQWKSSPSRNSTAEMLHIAALADDARTYEKAVEGAMACWNTGESGLSAEELRALIEGEYWILSSNTRSSGAGFSLKQMLASARRELDAARLNPPGSRDH